jgi:UDP-N-acetylglucosamine 2-epimerase (non-hydrolysing)
MTNSAPTVWVVYGTRPEVIKMAPVMKALRARAESVNVSGVFVGQHRELATDLLGGMNMQPDLALDVMSENQTMWGLGARCFTALGGLVESERPDCILVQGDTAPVLFASLISYFNKIRVGHVEAGLRSFDKYAPFPEEVMRKLTDGVADLHFAPTEYAATNLRTEGIDPGSVFVTGNTVIDAVWSAAELAEDYVSQKTREWVASAGGYVVVTLHRRESFGDDMTHLMNAIVSFARENPIIKFVYPVHPDPNVRMHVNTTLQGIDNVHLCDPVDYFDMVYLIKNCLTVLSDSGGVQEEGPALGKRVLVARTVTERPEGVQAGSARLVGFDERKILSGLSEEIERALQLEATEVTSTPYGDGKAGERIADIVISELCNVARRTEDWVA